MTRIGRNDPCPCGSGKKYKRCCLAHGRQPSPATAAKEELAAFLEAQEGVESQAELEQLVQDWQQARNTRAMDDFQGLSADQMYAMLYQPFDSPQYLQFHAPDETCRQAPILWLFEALAERLGDQGVKATAKGNLPRNLCREIALAYWGPERYEEETRYASISSEEKFADLHKMRLVAEQAGLLRKYKGRIILSRPARGHLQRSESGALYLQLLRTYAETFNWAYEDGYDELHIVQQAFAFSLYLLHRYGAKFRPLSFYEDAFIQAFPAALDEVGDTFWDDPEIPLRRCYSLRTLHRGLSFLGLVELAEQERKETRDALGLSTPQYTVRTTSLLEQVATFRA